MIGVSNTYDVKVLIALGKARKVQVVQNRWYEGNEWDKKVVTYCKENGIMYQCVLIDPSVCVILNEEVGLVLADPSGPSQARQHCSLIRQF